MVNKVVNVGLREDYTVYRNLPGGVLTSYVWYNKAEKGSL